MHIEQFGFILIPLDHSIENTFFTVRTANFSWTFYETVQLWLVYDVYAFRAVFEFQRRLLNKKKYHFNIHTY